MLHSLGALSYCPSLEARIRRLEPIPSGSSWELQIRGMFSLPLPFLPFPSLPFPFLLLFPSLPPPYPFNPNEYNPGCSIWAVELLRREILKLDTDAKVNAILIDFFLYDLAKEREKKGEEGIPHHRTRSIWY